MSSTDTHHEPPIKIKGLPPGWKREVVVRKNGQSAGKTDIYYYSPCGKKFRSKPQIARFLGETADLGCFDFSRAGTPGDGSQRRRARDRSAKKSMGEPVNKQIPTVRPLTNNPLRPSGPIRRTCGVIKLPVIWVAPPTDDELKNDATTAPPLPVPSLPTSQAKPPEASKPAPQPVPTLVAPVGNGATELVVPAMWENSLVGVKPCDHETGMEIVVTVNKPQNGLNVCGAGALPEAGVNGGELNSNVLQNSPSLQNLIRQQQQQQQKKSINLVASLSASGQQGLQGSIASASPPQQNLIQSIKSQQKHLVSSTGSSLLTQPGMVLTSASLTNLLRQQQQSLQKQQQHCQHGMMVTSGRTTTTSTRSTAGGSVSSIGMAMTGNGRSSHHHEGGSIGGGGRISGSGGHILRPSNQQGHHSHKDRIKLSLTGGAASSPTNTFGSTASISNGPTSMDIDTEEGVNTSSKFVSDSEIQLQEEKVRQLRQQLLAAAQAAAKGSAVV